MTIHLRLAAVVGALVGAALTPLVLAPSAMAAPMIGIGPTIDGSTDRGPAYPDRGRGPDPAIAPALGSAVSLPAPGGAGQIVTVATIGSDLSIVPVEMPMPARAATMAEFRLPAGMTQAAQQGISTVFGAPSFGKLRSFVPELSTWLMMIAGLALAGLYIRRWRNRAGAALTTASSDS